MSSADNDARLEALLDFLRQARAADSAGLRRAALIRQVDRRMQAIAVHDHMQYLDYLRSHRDQVDHLLDTILVNATSFFRDPPAWELLAQEVLPRLLDNKPAEARVRVWCAGCASGEETFSIAALLNQVLGTEEFLKRVKIYGTDVDDEALGAARQGSYPAEDLEYVPAEMRDDCFDLFDGRYVFRADLRRAIIFGHHDLVRDAPISYLDLLLCRNTLTYLSPDAQVRVLNRFQFALRDQGILFLGIGERLPAGAGRFRSISLQFGMFAKTKLTPGEPPGPDLQDRRSDLAAHINQYALLRSASLEVCPVAQILLAPNQTIIAANQRARTLLGLTLADIGKPFDKLSLSNTAAELQTRIGQTLSEPQHRRLADIAIHRPNSGADYIDVEVSPLYDDNGLRVGTSLILSDATRVHSLQEELRRAREALQSAGTQENGTSGTAQAVSPSTGAEQPATEAAPPLRSDDPGETVALLEATLSSLSTGVCVLDRDRNIVFWNRSAAALWGRRADEVLHRPLFELDLGLPLAELKEMLQQCASGSARPESLPWEGTNRRGESLRCRLTCAPLAGPEGDARGIVVMMDPLGE